MKFSGEREREKKKGDELADTITEKSNHRFRDGETISGGKSTR